VCIVNSFVHCDRDSLRQVLRDGLPTSRQSRLEEHLATCADCRLELDRLAGGGDWRSEVRKHLSSAEIPPYHPEDTRSKSTPGTWTRDDYGWGGHDDGDAGDKLDFLEPSDDPTKLGRLGSYEIDSVIGRGGMGIVLKAFDAALNRHVAIKVLAAQLATNGSARKRFSREAQAAAAVVHEHVVAIHAVDISSKLPFIVMRYVPGRSLQDRLDANGSLETKEILRISIQTAAGLAAAHAQGLVHRDIKPANILLENGVERVRITDFGLARAVDDASQTQSGFIAGTPQYMAPEQARGEPVDHRSDLFSLGSVMYTMCSGHPPFRAETTLAVLRRICEESPRPLQEINPDVPDWLQAIISKLHARESSDRFQSAAEVAALLEQYLAHVQQPTINPMPQFHVLTRRARQFARIDWRRIAMWGVPASLVVCLTMLVASILSDRNVSSERSDFPNGSSAIVNQSPVPDSMDGDSASARSASGASSRDPWRAWEIALNQVNTDLEQLEIELVRHPNTISASSDQQTLAEMEEVLKVLDEELKDL
jgi:serine/threonine protein kinase